MLRWSVRPEVAGPSAFAERSAALAHLVALPAALAAALGGQLLLNRQAYVAGAALLALAAGLWFWVASKHRDDGRALLAGGDLICPRRWLAGTLAVVAAGLGGWAWLRLDVRQATNDDWLRYAASLSVFVVAILVATPWKQYAAWSWRRGWKLGLLLGVLLLGAQARLTNLDSLPFGTWYDEAASGLEALRMVREPGYRPIFTDGINATGQYLWLIVAAFRTFGATTAAIRTISALFGVFTVAAAYLVGRELRGSVLGLAFALVVAVGHWSLNFSRLGMYNSATPLFELLAFGLLLRAMRTGAAADFAWTGLALGLGLCSYSAFQLFGPVLALFLVVVVARERQRWPRLVTGMAVAVVAAVLVIAPVAKFAWERPDRYFARIETTSILAVTAPDERLPALWANTVKHLLMFHVRGDPNGRHNLAGAPLLDWISGGLMVLGLAMCSANWRRAEYAAIPIWLGCGLLGGILSLDFEAPQSLRSIASQPAAYLLVALPIQALADGWHWQVRPRWPSLGAMAGAALLAPMVWANLHAYFVRQPVEFSSWNNYSTPETLAAQVLRSAPPGIEPYVIALYDGHPTVRFLAGDVPHSRIETNAALPILRQEPGGMLLILDAERRELYEEARRIYPAGRFAEVRPPFGGPVILYTALLDAATIATVQGLEAAYRGGDGTIIARQDATLDFGWPKDSPAALPFTVEWQGTLAADAYGPYLFLLEAPGPAELRIGEQVVTAGDGSAGPLVGGVLLARGLHRITVTAEGAEGSLRLMWQPPSGAAGVVPAWALYTPPVRNNGLLGRYFANGEWAGDATFAQIDPKLGMYFHVPTLPRPYTVEWTGKIAIPVSGRYTFGLQSIDESTLWIDGDEVAAAHARGQLARGQTSLGAGLHDLRVRYADRTDHTNIYLYWQPPGASGSGALQVVPSELLFPPQADYPEVDVSRLARFLAMSAQSGTAVAADWVDTATVQVVADGLDSPRGVAVQGDTVYVAETGAGRVLAVNSATGNRAVLGGMPQLIEPFDLAVGPDGALFVLDAGAGALWRVAEAGGDSLAAPVPVVSDLLVRSRGIGVDGRGRIWVANTPGGRVVAFDTTGHVLAEVAQPPLSGASTPMQPVDVVVDLDSVISVADVSNHTLVRFDDSGYLLARQTVPVANSMDGPHFALDAGGALLMSEPETGRIVRLDPAGAVINVWSARTTDTPDAKPVGLAIDGRGRIWTADPQGGRLLVVTPGGD
jgi:sugar lactone lactonase YvrE/4-amino-4-deoxy-L-arabinose transferase-like glycosyltransferase